ncbi:ATP-grasp domain-containing protein [Actinokineospora sp.]|uniref:ATP-grasp domain-containing protein n=1 Tax=Actinokineospora sp. TaxID=1872133 RepID=UPI0040376DD8
MPWMFEAARRAGVELVLVTKTTPAADERLPDEVPAGVVEVLSLDITETDSAVAALREVHSRRPIDGVVAGSDGAVHFAASAARALGLPALSAAAALAVRDKRIMRERLRDAGLNTPPFLAIAGPDQWQEAATLRFPVVVKPAGGFTSLGVAKAESAADLEATVRQVWDVCVRHLRFGAGTAAFEGLIVEEFMDGPEYCVESLTYQGETRVHTIGYKGTPMGPYFEETIYRAPAPLSDELERAIHDQIVGAHAAFGVTDGPTHAELRIHQGAPHLLEMGARVGASGASHHIVAGVTGVDFGAETYRIAMGLRPSSWAEPVAATGVAAMYFVQVGGSGTIADIVGLDGLDDDARVDRVVRMMGPGDVVRPYPEYSGYPGFILSNHPDYADAESFHRQLDDTVRITYH